MKNCQVIYPLKVIRPLPKVKVDHRKHLSDLIKSIHNSGGIIEHYIADNLKRATARECLNHAAAFPCEYCFTKGVRFCPNHKNDPKRQFKLIRDKLSSIPENEELKDITKQIDLAEKKVQVSKRSHIVWPSSTFGGDPRTKDNMLEIACEIQARGRENVPIDEAKGVKGKSPLFDIPGFDFVRDCPTEYLHSTCLGVVKSMVKLTFNVSESGWERVTKRKLSSPKEYNLQMKKVKSTREFSRRNRELDFAVMKAQEFRNMLIVYFPNVIHCIEPNAKERKLWLMFAYVIRACILPNDEFKKVEPLDSIMEITQEFYVLYEQLFGPRNCTYNTHIVGSHLIEMRVHGPFTETSAFGFESFYGELRNSFTPGTQSTLLQCMKKILLKRTIGYHNCKNTIYYSSKDSCLESNSLIYVFKNLTHKIYKITDINGDILMCNEVGKYKCQFKEVKDLNWSNVGVYRKGPMSKEITPIHKELVSGKVIDIKNLLVTCPNNI